jgi:Spy/CpxP family protein refolding chaperone
MNKMMRAFAVCTLIAGMCLFAQAVNRPWWNGQTIRELNLSPDQLRQMRATMREYRPHLQELRAAVQKAEQDLQAAFNSDPVDAQKANEAIGRLVAARSELTRELSKMGLKLRTVLTFQQWQEVQKRFPPRPPVGASGS